MQCKIIYHHQYQKIHLKEAIIDMKHLHELKIFKIGNYIKDSTKERYYTLLWSNFIR